MSAVRYKILEEIGKGSMGEVWLAEDTILSRKVALKFLKLELAQNEEYKERMLREARAIARLNHPNIVRVFDINEFKDSEFRDGQYVDRLYIAMEYVDGKPLGAYLKKKIDIIEIIKISVQITNALGYAHSQEVIHRDIKPDNILINMKGQVKIVDFGLVKLSNISRPQTKDIIMGTLHYMSPEQAGGSDDIDYLTDIFSFGIVLYKMITGEKPFKGETIDAVIKAILNDSPEPLSKFNKEATPGLQIIIDKILAKKRDERYQDAAEIEMALNKEMELLTSLDKDDATEEISKYSEESTIRISNLEDQPPRYKIQSVIKKTGMSEVVLAYDTKLERKVILKFLADPLKADQEYLDRMKREARIIAKLNNPNIVQVYDFYDSYSFKPYKGRFCIVMEYIEGLSLRDRVKAEHLPALKLAEIIDICKQVCDALGAAHLKGIFHRDIKPENIMIENTGLVKLLDFGIAKSAHTTRTSSKDQIIGTIHYLSPEQADGKDLDSRTDIFSLGIVMYELLTGDLPFKGDIPAVVINAIQNKIPKPITGYDIRYPKELQKLINKLLDKDRNKRCQSTAEVRAELEKIEKILVHPSPSPINWRRITTWSILVMIVILTLIIIFPQIMTTTNTNKRIQTPSNPPISDSIAQKDNLDNTPPDTVSTINNEPNENEFREQPVASLGTIQVYSKPPDANIYLDRTNKGIVTPQDMPKVITGTHKITLRKEGYEDWHGSVEVKVGETAKVFAELKALRYKVNIILEPKEEVFTLFIDSNLAKTNITESYTIDIEHGEHLIYIESYRKLDDSKVSKFRWNKQFTVKNNFTLNINFNKTVLLKILAFDEDDRKKGLRAKVFIDGKFEKNLPGEIKVSYGLHEIEVRIDGYISYSRTQQFEETQTMEIFLKKD
ncbi:MAG: hypothetical protein CV087_21660 [Candidatus Brocadia sp. WS118]|nr:MAG: hypothetical protein CV087_21660 [Candidatus Brocadia sp. WS118]